MTTIMRKGNATVNYTINGDVISGILTYNGDVTQRFEYTGSQWLAVKASFIAVGFKEVNEKGAVNAPQKVNKPKKTWEQHLTESFGDKEARRHFIEVRNSICTTAMAYFRKKYSESGITLDKAEYKAAEKKFVNAWANRVIAAEC